MKFLIKYATRGRSEYFKRAIINIINTIRTEDYLILVTADVDDPSMYNDEIKEFCDRPHVKVMFSRSASKIDAINRDMNIINCLNRMLGSILT